MASVSQQPATSIIVGGRTFISHLYSSSQALDLLLMLGEALSGALSKLLDRPVTADMSDLAEAVDELRDQVPTTGAMLSLFGSLRKTGGADLVVQVLSTTYFEDRAIDSRKRFDEVFRGPSELLDAANLTWRVLVYQLSPLWEGVRLLLSERAEALKAAEETRKKSAQTSTGGSGVQ